MTDRDYILAGNYKKLDELYKCLDTAENRVASLSEALASREEMLDIARAQRDATIAALKQADDTLSWAQHFLNHADRESIPATVAQIRSVLADIGE